MPPRRFNTAGDCRRYLASVINRLEDGKITPDIAGRAAYITNIIIRAIEGSDLEDRLNELEKKINEGTDCRSLRVAR